MYVRWHLHSHWILEPYTTEKKKKKGEEIFWATDSISRMLNETPILKDFRKIFLISFLEKFQTWLIQYWLIIDEQSVRVIYGDCKRLVLNRIYCSGNGHSLGSKTSSDVITSCTVKLFKPKVGNWIKWQQRAISVLPE